MIPLFGRDYQVLVQTSDQRDAVEVLPPLSFEFDISKTLKRKPNEGTVTLYNLAPATRNAILAVDKPRVVVRVGYVATGVFEIFSGDCDAHKEREGVDVSIVLEGKDGGDSYRRRRIQQSFAAGTKVDVVARACITQLGIGEGNLSSFADELHLASGATEYGDGFSADGHIRDIFDDIVRTSGFGWSIQGGVLQLRRNNEPLRRRVEVLSPDTGLIGSPTIDDKGIVSATALIRPGLNPGERVELRSQDYPGEYEVQECEYKGDSTGDEWDAVLQLKAA